MPRLSERRRLTLEVSAERLEATNTFLRANPALSHERDSALDWARALARPMKIYTKTGDAGETRLYGGTKVDKDDLRVESYGTVDELNAALGVARAIGLATDVDELCAAIQSALFVVGSELASLPENRHKLKLTLIGAADIQSLEFAIDRYTEELPALSQFVLPGGARGAAELHQARTICRRAERQLVTLKKQSEVSGELLVYLNRLGDLLFVLARLENHRAGVSDVPWNPR